MNFNLKRVYLVFVAIGSVFFFNCEVSSGDAVEEANESIEQKLALSYESIFSISPRKTIFLSDTCHKADKGWLGISMVDKEMEGLKNKDKKNQIMIQYVMEGSPAEKYGLEKNDIIIKLNNETIEPDSSASLSQLFAGRAQKFSPGTKVSISVIRDGSEHKISLVLGKKPKASIIMAKHENIEGGVHRDASLLEKTLSQKKMLRNYYKAAESIKEKSSDIVSYRFSQGGYNPFRLKEVNYFLNFPLNIHRVTKETTSGIKDYFNGTDQNYSDLSSYMAVRIDENYKPDQQCPVRFLHPSFISSKLSFLHVFSRNPRQLFILDAR